MKKEYEEFKKSMDDFFSKPAGNICKRWVSVKERMPANPDWYYCITIHGEFKVPLSHTLKGELVWVTPAPENITHWEETYFVPNK